MEVSHSAEGVTLKNTVNTVKAEIRDILQSGKFYCTEEIARELTAIDNGVEHLRLDSTLLMSDEWRNSFRPSETKSFGIGATQVLRKAVEHLSDFKIRMKADVLRERQENELRELHQRMVTTLRQIQQDMAPYTQRASDRIKLFGDQAGVTDRYIGYRNNLTRGSREPVKMESYWMDKGSVTGFMNPVSRPQTTLGFPSREQPYSRPVFEQVSFGSVAPQNIGVLKKEIRFTNNRPPMSISKGYRTIDSLYPCSNTAELPGTRVGGAPNFSEHLYNTCVLNNWNATQNAAPCKTRRETYIASMGSGVRNLSVQEQAGINTTFPGKTEYMVRYNTSFDSKPTDYIINPKHDLNIYGRPLGVGCYYPDSTEYQNRYEWPDGNKICKLPWLRK